MGFLRGCLAAPMLEGRALTGLERFRFQVMKIGLVLIACVFTLSSLLDISAGNTNVSRYIVLSVVFVYTLWAYFSPRASWVYLMSPHVLLGLYVFSCVRDSFVIDAGSYVLLYSPLVIMFCYLSILPQKQARVWGVAISLMALLTLFTLPEQKAYLLRLLTINLITLLLIDRFVAFFHFTLGEVDRVNESLSLEKVRADQANNAKTDFLASMSHEIRTPLNGVFGALQVIQNNRNDS